MDHDDAIRSHAAERYVAGELAPPECDAFEEHFFDCRECAEEVRWEQIFAANARAVAREQAVLPPPSGFPEKWRAWFSVRPALALSVAANAVLLLGLVYVSTTGSRRFDTQPRMLLGYFAPAPARAQEQAQPLPAGASSFVAHFPAPDQPYPSYSYQFLNAAGNPESSGSVAAPTVRQPELFLEVPVRQLPAGVHTLVIRDNTGNQVLAQFQFRTSR